MKDSEISITKSWQAYVIRSNGDMYELPVASVNWTGQKYAGPRSITLDILSTQKGLHQKTPIDEGDGLVFKINGNERFRGIIVSKSSASDDRLSVTAQDVLRFLCQNRTAENIKNMTLSGLVKYLCKKFDIPVGAVAETQTKITRLFKNQTLFDIILTYINYEYKKTGTKYYLRADGDKVSLVKRTAWAVTWVIEKNINLIDYERTRDISELYSQVRLGGKVTVTTTEKKTSGKTTAKETEVTVQKESTKEITAVATSPVLKKRYGTLQYYEDVSDETNQAKLLAQAKQMLKEKGKVKETFDLDALGIPEIISGSVVYVIVPELAVKQAFYVDKDTHSFDGIKHTMSLSLTKSDELPELDASSKDTTKEETEKKAADDKKVDKDKDKKDEDKKDKEPDFYESLIAEIQK